MFISILLRSRSQLATISRAFQSLLSASLCLVSDKSVHKNSHWSSTNQTYSQRILFRLCFLYFLYWWTCRLHPIKTRDVHECVCLISCLQFRSYEYPRKQQTQLTAQTTSWRTWLNINAIITFPEESNPYLGSRKAPRNTSRVSMDGGHEGRSCLNNGHGINYEAN